MIQKKMKKMKHYKTNENMIKIQIIETVSLTGTKFSNKKTEVSKNQGIKYTKEELYVEKCNR